METVLNTLFKTKKVAIGTSKRGELPLSQHAKTPLTKAFLVAGMWLLFGHVAVFCPRTSKDVSRNIRLMARTTQGTVYKRDKQGKEIPRVQERTTPGSWYAAYQHNGKRIRLALGQEIHNRETAESKLKGLINPYTASSSVERTKRAYTAIMDAEDAAKAAKAERLRVPLAEVWERFPLIETVRGRTRHALSSSVIKDNESCWRKFLGFLAQVPPAPTYLQELTPEHGATYSQLLRQGGKLSSHRHNVIILTLRSICRHAGLEDARNPFSAVSMYAGKPVSREPLTLDELMKVCHAATGELRILLALGIFTGLRLGDCVQLCWEDIDSITGVIHKQASKTAKLAVMPLHPDLLQLLNETPKEQRQGLVLPGLAGRYRKDRPSVSLLVGTHFRKCGLATTGPVTPGHLLRTRLRGFHSLRSSVASMAVRAGASAEQVAQMLGHTTQVSREHYIQAGMESARKVIQSLPSGLFASVASPTRLALPAETLNILTSENIGELVQVLERMTATDWQESRDRALAMLGKKTTMANGK
jgi:integrase